MGSSFAVILKPKFLLPYPGIRVREDVKFRGGGGGCRGKNKKKMPKVIRALNDIILKVLTIF